MWLLMVVWKEEKERIVGKESAVQVTDDKWVGEEVTKNSRELSAFKFPSAVNRRRQDAPLHFCTG